MLKPYRLVTRNQLRHWGIAVAISATFAALTRRTALGPPIALLTGLFGFIFLFGTALLLMQHLGARYARHPQRTAKSTHARARSSRDAEAFFAELSRPQGTFGGYLERSWAAAPPGPQFRGKGWRPLIRNLGPKLAGLGIGIGLVMLLVWLAGTLRP